MVIPYNGVCVTLVRDYLEWWRCRCTRQNNTFELFLSTHVTFSSINYKIHDYLSFLRCFLNWCRHFRGSVIARASFVFDKQLLLLARVDRNCKS